MCGLDDLSIAVLAVSTLLSTAPWGGELQRILNRASIAMWRSDNREFVANRAGDSDASDRYLSLIWEFGGAVPPLASARPYRAPKKERKSSNISARPVLPILCQRLARLCVLMNPILPGALSIGTWPAFASSETLGTGAFCLNPSR